LIKRKNCDKIYKLNFIKKSKEDYMFERKSHEIKEGYERDNRK